MKRFVGSSDLAVRIHLITTDVSVFRLVDSLATKLIVTAVIVPSNRNNSIKTQSVVRESKVRHIPVLLHRLNQEFQPSMPDADIAVSWMYSQVICGCDLKRYKLGAINMHGGKIPEYRGANVLQWAIINGEPDLGVTWHLMVDAVDAGDICAEGTVPIAPDSDAWQIRRLMIDKGVRLFPEAFTNLVEGRSIRKPVVSEGKVWPVRRRVDGEIQPLLPEQRLKNLVRALCSPWPRAFIRVGDKIVPIVSVCRLEGRDTYPYRTAEGKTVFLQGQPG